MGRSQRILDALSSLTKIHSLRVCFIPHYFPHQLFSVLFSIILHTCNSVFYSVFCSALFWTPVRFIPQIFDDERGKGETVSAHENLVEKYWDPQKHLSNLLCSKGWCRFWCWCWGWCICSSLCRRRGQQWRLLQELHLQNFILCGYWPVGVWCHQSIPTNTWWARSFDLVNWWAPWVCHSEQHPSHNACTRVPNSCVSWMCVCACKLGYTNEVYPEGKPKVLDGKTKVYTWSGVLDCQLFTHWCVNKTCDLSVNYIGWEDEIFFWGKGVGFSQELFWDFMNTVIGGWMSFTCFCTERTRVYLTTNSKSTICQQQNFHPSCDELDGIIPTWLLATYWPVVQAWSEIFGMWNTRFWTILSHQWMEMRYLCHLSTRNFTGACSQQCPMEGFAKCSSSSALCMVTVMVSTWLMVGRAEKTQLQPCSSTWWGLLWLCMFAQWIFPTGNQHSAIVHVSGMTCSTGSTTSVKIVSNRNVSMAQRVQSNMHDIFNQCKLAFQGLCVCSNQLKLRMCLTTISV